MPLRNMMMPDPFSALIDTAQAIQSTQKHEIRDELIDPMERSSSGTPVSSLSGDLQALSGGGNQGLSPVHSAGQTPAAFMRGHDSFSAVPNLISQLNMMGTGFEEQATSSSGIRSLGAGRRSIGSLVGGAAGSIHNTSVLSGAAFGGTDTNINSAISSAVVGINEQVTALMDVSGGRGGGAIIGQSGSTSVRKGVIRPPDDDRPGAPTKSGKGRERRRTQQNVDPELLQRYDASDNLEGVFYNKSGNCYQALVGSNKFVTFPIGRDDEVEASDDDGEKMLPRNPHDETRFRSGAAGISWNAANMAWVAQWYDAHQMKVQYFGTNKTHEGEYFEAALRAAIQKRKEIEELLGLKSQGGRSSRTTKRAKRKFLPDEALRLAIEARNKAVREGRIVPKSMKPARFRSGVTGVIWNNNYMAWQAHWKQDGKLRIVSFPTGKTVSGPKFEDSLRNAIKKRKEMEVSLGIKPRRGKDDVRCLPPRCQSVNQFLNRKKTSSGPLVTDSLMESSGSGSMFNHTDAVGTDLTSTVNYLPGQQNTGNEFDRMGASGILSGLSQSQNFGTWPSVNVNNLQMQDQTGINLFSGTLGSTIQSGEVGSVLQADSGPAPDEDAAGQVGIFKVINLLFGDTKFDS